MYPPPRRPPRSATAAAAAAAAPQAAAPAGGFAAKPAYVLMWRSCRKLQLNAAARELLGGAGEGGRLLRRTAMALLHDVLAGGGQTSCRVTLRNRQGYRLVGRPLTRGPRGEAGAVCRITAVIPAQRREDAARRPAALDHLPHPVWQLGEAGEVEFLNAAARKLVAQQAPPAGPGAAPGAGAAAAAATPSTVDPAQLWPLNWVHPDEQASVHARWHEARRCAGPLHVRCRLNLPPGRGYRWYVVRATPQQLGGRPAGWVVTVQDEHEAHEMREDLRLAACLRNNFLRVASHELSTPLTSLQLALQLASTRMQRVVPSEQTRAPVAEPLRRALDDTRRLVDIVSDLLDIKRLQLGKFFLRRRRVDLVQLLQDMLQRLNKPLRDAGCTFDFHPGDGAHDELTGEWDDVRLQQVFFHLVHNAIKYAPGTPLHVRCGISGGEAYVAVEDEGPGIPAGLRKKIFGLFERATEIRGTSGLGMGLYLCRRIVHAHHGHLRLISRDGKGAKFIVSLPRHEPASSPAPDWHVATAPAAPHPGAGKPAQLRHWAP